MRCLRERSQERRTHSVTHDEEGLAEGHHLRTATEFFLDGDLDGQVRRRGDGDKDLEEAVDADDPPFFECTPVHWMVLVFQPDLGQDTQRRRFTLWEVAIFRRRFFVLRRVHDLLLRRGIAHVVHVVRGEGGRLLD